MEQRYLSVNESLRRLAGERLAIEDVVQEQWSIVLGELIAQIDRPDVANSGSSLFRVGNWGVTVVHRSISEPLMAIASGFAANSVSVEQGGPRRRSAESN